MKSYSRSHTRNGFTLIELLVVIIILAILAAVVIPKVVGRTDDARMAAAIADVSAFSSALQMYKADTGMYPTSDQGLNALINNPGVPGWNKPYLDNMSVMKNDPWGHPYIYKYPSDHGQDFDIISLGPEGQAGAQDNVESWNLSKAK
jgi:general secretion pathway protein G